MDASTLMSVVTYDTAKCELDNVETSECFQRFDVYVQSYTGIFAKAATLKMTFESECAGFRKDYDKLPLLRPKGDA